MSTLATLATVRRSWDADAGAYIKAVESADQQQLEPMVAQAINQFVLGCKADGIWSAIKASCILMGARTLSGALTPLVGTAPTNSNFVSGDYARKTGLVGNGSTKYLDSSRSNNAEGQNDKHISVYQSALCNLNSTTIIGALPNTGAGRTDLEQQGTTSPGMRFYCNSVNIQVLRSGTATGFLGAARSSSAQIISRQNGSTQTDSINSQTPYSGNIFVFARNLNGSANQYSNPRLAWYSIGSSLTLATLDTRVSALYTAIGAAIA